MTTQIDITPMGRGHYRLSYAPINGNIITAVTTNTPCIDEYRSEDGDELSYCDSRQQAAAYLLEEILHNNELAAREVLSAEHQLEHYAALKNYSIGEQPESRRPKGATVLEFADEETGEVLEAFIFNETIYTLKN